MKGAADYSTSSEIDLAAILAGNDILLIPQDVPATVSLMQSSLQSGVLSQERLDESVRKILLAKYKVGLNNFQPIDTLNLVEDLNNSWSILSNISSTVWIGVKTSAFALTRVISRSTPLIYSRSNK